MKRTGWIVLAAIAGVAAILYFALDDGGGRNSDRRGARSEDGTESSRRFHETARKTDSPDADGDRASSALTILVTPEGEAEIVVTGPSGWRGRTDAAGRAQVPVTARGRYAVTARREKLVAARAFDLDGSTTIELSLSPGVVISGTVRDALGSGIHSASVEASPASSSGAAGRGWSMAGLAEMPPPVFAAATSGADGAYELALPGAGRYAIAAHARGFASGEFAPRLFETATDGVDFRLDPGAEVSGRVIGPDGEPVAGAWVMLHTNSPAGSRSASTTSDDAGSFRLDAPVEAWTSLVVHASGFASAFHPNLRAPVRGLDVYLERGLVAEARLVIAGTAGQPAPGVPAILSSSGTSREAVSDDQGVLRFDAVPSTGGAANWRYLQVAGGGFVPHQASLGSLAAEDGRIDLGTIELEPGATVRGRVTDAATGAPVADADVRWWSGKYRGFTRHPLVGATSDAQGRYELTGVPPDVVAILALHERYASNVDRRDLFSRLRDKDALLLAPGQLLLEHDIALPRAAAVTGTVMDADGNPVAGAIVQGPFAAFLPGASNVRPTAATGADGRFTLDGFAEGENVALTVQHPQHGSVAVPDAKAGSDVEVRFVGTMSITGRVLDPDGKPVALARVSALRRAAPRRSPLGAPRDPETATGVDGRFLLLGVPRDEHQLTISHPQFRVLRRAATEGDLGDLRLERGPGIEGRVVDEDGRPLGGAGVVLRLDSQEDERTSQGERSYVQLSSGPDGSFSAYGLAAKPYRIVVSAGDRFAPQPVVTPSATDVVITARRGVVWTGRILVRGEPVAQAFASAALPDGKGAIASGRSGSDGRIALGPLPPDGTFDLTISHSNFLPFHRKGATASSLPAEIELDPGATIRGVVVEKGGGPIEGAHVQARARSNPAIKWTQTKADGSFELSGLDADTIYEVYVAFTQARHVTGDPVERKPGGEAIRFELIAGHEIRGRVKASDPVKLGNVRVIAYDAEGKERANTWVLLARDDKFTLASLAPGSYTLKVVSGWGEHEKVLQEAGPVEAGATGVELTVDG